MTSKADSFARKLREQLPRWLPWEGSFFRVVADMLFVNISMFSAIGLWHALRHTPPTPPPRLITGAPVSLLEYALVWTVLAIAVLHVNEVYSRVRGFVTRYKAWVILRSVAVIAALLFLGDYFLLRNGVITRGVAFFAFVLLFATIGGARLASATFLNLYRVEPRRPLHKKVKRVLVVGGAGYIGSVLVPKLFERDYQVRVLDSLMYGPEPLDAVKNHPDFELVKGDVRDIQSVVDAMKDCDAVIDLAAIVGDPACEENRQVAVEVNRAATRMLIDVAKGYGVRRFIFASTCSVYGATESLMDEHSQTSPISTYARTKVDSEKLLLESATPDFHPTILRLGTVFGLSPRPRFDLVVNLLTARAAMTGKITIFNGNQWRPFLHVSDVARAFVTALDAPTSATSGEIFNVGDYDLNYRLTDISEMVAKMVPHLEVSHVENGDKRNYRVSFDKIHSRLGFRCEKDVPDGIQEIYEWIKVAGILDFNAAQFNNQAMMRVVAAAGVQQSTLRVLEALSKCA